MKNLFIVAVALLCILPLGMAQKHFHNEALVLPLQSQNQEYTHYSYFTLNQEFEGEWAITELAQKLGFHANYSWSLDTLVESQTGIHYLFYADVNGIKVHSFSIKVNVNQQSKRIQSVFTTGEHTYFSEINTKRIQLQKVLDALESLHIHKLDYKTQPTYWLNKSTNEMELGWQIDVLDVHEMHTELVFTTSQKPVYVLVKNRFSRAFETDTTLTGSVFNPDPLTSAGVVYGGQYVDSADADLQVLNQQLVQRSAVGTFENQQIALKNNYIQISDHSFPSVAPATFTSDTIQLTRGQPEFEDFNAYYHINKYQEYVQLLGFTNLVNYPIRVDVHALGGQDQSSFGEFLNPPTLSFGEGGVDDAEDADVIVHEYGHAISYSAAPNTNIGTQRQTLDEALGDYIAVSYSREINPFNWDYVFNWDGHNEFWDGRMAYSNETFPSDLQNDIYADADIWSSALLDIENTTSRYATHRILFESLYSYAPNITMQAAAKLFEQADSTIFNGAYHSEICTAFANRGILESNCVVSVPSFFRVDPNEVAALHKNYLEVYTTAYNELKIMNLQGQIVAQTKLSSNSINLSHFLKSDVLYVIQLATSHGDTVQLKYLHNHAN